jgi:hypothetical protein
VAGVVGATLYVAPKGFGFVGCVVPKGLEGLVRGLCRTEKGDQRGGEWEPIKILANESLALIPSTHPTQES